MVNKDAIAFVTALENDRTVWPQLENASASAILQLARERGYNVTIRDLETALKLSGVAPASAGQMYRGLKDWKYYLAKIASVIMPAPADDDASGNAVAGVRG
jgi:hypothetical protein